MNNYYRDIIDAINDVADAIEKLDKIIIADEEMTDTVYPFNDDLYTTACLVRRWASQYEFNVLKSKADGQKYIVERDVSVNGAVDRIETYCTTDSVDSAVKIAHAMNSQCEELPDGESVRYFARIDHMLNGQEIAIEYID